LAGCRHAGWDGWLFIPADGVSWILAALRFAVFLLVVVAPIVFVSGLFELIV
jgi:hypothetical protein